DCASLCCGLCCISLFSALQPWCNTRAFGSGSGRNGRSGRTAGCCNRCCAQSFGDDDFDRQLEEDMERTRARDATGAPHA
ncbi:hypothetical protein FISHEDRAFT_16425, partial [Fistulina hepatica ATCC 64428]